MRSRPLSASSIKTFLQCALKYYFRYEDKKPREGKSDPLAFGIAMHSALEFMCNELKKTKTAPSPETYNKVLEVFMQEAASNGLEDLSTYQEGRDMLINRLDNADPNEKIIGLELNFNLKTPKGTAFLGSIDKLIELDAETAVIIDYKTSRTALSQTEADHDIQLSMYDLAVSQMFPQYKTIVCAFDYLRLTEVITHRTPDQRKLFVDFLDATYEGILALEGNDIKPNLNGFCPWCEFKGFCPDYKKLIEDPELIIPPIGEMENDKFVESWDRISAAKRIIDARQREFKADAYERLKSKPTIRGEERELYKTQTSRASYDAKTVFKVVGPENYVRMSSVSKTAVDKHLLDNPEAAAQVEETATFSFNSPSFRTRKVKKNEDR